MEVRVARIESDIVHINREVPTAGDQQTSSAELKADFAAVGKDIKALIKGWERNMIRLIVGAIAVEAGLAFAIGRFIH